MVLTCDELHLELEEKFHMNREREHWAGAHFNLHDCASDAKLVKNRVKSKKKQKGGNFPRQIETYSYRCVYATYILTACIAYTSSHGLNAVKIHTLHD